MQTVCINDKNVTIVINGKIACKNRIRIKKSSQFVCNVTVQGSLKFERKASLAPMITLESIFKKRQRSCYYLIDEDGFFSIGISFIDTFIRGENVNSDYFKVVCHPNKNKIIECCLDGFFLKLRSII